MTPDSQNLRADLCARLQAQRRIVGQQLGFAGGRAIGYPRSKTMRLLTGRTAVLISALGGLARLFQRR